MESEHGDTAEPTKEGAGKKKPHQKKKPDVSCQLAGSQESRQENQTGDVSTEKIGTLQPQRYPISRDRVLPQTHVSESLLFTAIARGYALPSVYEQNYHEC